MPSKTAILFLSVFFAGAFGALSRSPHFGILLYEVQYFVNPAGSWWYGDLPDLRYSMTVVLLILIGMFLHPREPEGNLLITVPQTKWIVLLGGVILVTSLWAVDPSTHYEFALRWFKVLLFAVLAFWLIDTPRKMEALLGVYLLGIFYLSWSGWVSGRRYGDRLEGIGTAESGDANGTAAVVVTAVPLLLFYLLYGKSRWVKGSALLALAFVLNFLVLLNSRGAFLALVVCCAYFALHVVTEKGQVAARWKLLAGMLGAGALFLYLADDLFWMRMATLENVDPEEGSGRRWLLWMKTFDLLQDYPLGAGARGYDYLSPNYMPGEWLTEGRRAVHSTWFEVLSDYGYHGLGLFLGLIGSCFLFLRRVRRSLRKQGATYPLLQSVAMESALIGLLVAGSFVNFFYGELLYWWVFFIAAFGSIHFLRDPGKPATGADDG